MAEPIQKITAEQLAQMGVVAAPDKLTGNPQENKMIFDRLICEVVAVAVNTAIDVLNEMIPAENGRETAEAERVSAEEQRVQAEANRVTAEEERETAEDRRETAEAERNEAEEARNRAEQERANQNTGIVAQASEQAADAARSAEEAAASVSDAAAEAASAEAEAKRAEELAANIGAHGEEVSATLLASEWIGSGPYVQLVSVFGVNENSFGNIGIPVSATDDQRAAAKDASMYLSAVDTNVVAITADGEKPAIDIPIVVQFGMVIDGGTGSVPGGDAPYIGENGNWYVGQTDTGVAATGPAGVAPEINLDRVSNGTQISITYPDGAFYAIVIPDGQDGQDGSPGADGQAATFEIVSTETLEPGQAASVTETEDSTPQERKYIISIPKGDTGEPGLIGPRGYQGVPGLDGEDGFSPEVYSEEITGGYMLHVTTAAGTNSFPVYHGSDGPQGPTGPIGPQGPAGPALAVTNTAAVGQTVKITAVDEDGQPTAWEAADMESVDAAYELAATIEITESVSSITQEFGKAYNELYIFFDGVASSASCQIGINKLLSENNWLTTATGYKAARLIHRPGICIERQDSNPATYGFWQGANVTRRFDFSKDSDFESVVIYTSNPPTATINSGTIKIYGR